MHKKQSIWFCLFALAACVCATEYYPNDGSPITSYTTDIGDGGLERVTQLKAEIRPEHIASGRTSFPSSAGARFNMAQGDELGHIVGSQFSGPIEWYNLTPQSSFVNRNVGGERVVSDWYKTERKARKYLGLGGNRQVNWNVNMDYNDGSNRPSYYRLSVDYLENGAPTRNEEFGADHIYLRNSPAGGAGFSIPRRRDRI